MIKRKANLRHNQEIELKGGKGTLELVNFLEQEEACGKGRLFAVCSIPPGASIGEHQHQGDFEIYYMLEGVAHVWDNGQEGTLHPGDCMVCHDGDSHSIENRGREEVKYLAMILFTEKS